MFGEILFEYARLMLWGSLLCTAVLLFVSGAYYGVRARQIRNRATDTTPTRLEGGFRGN